jgi:hypothetical protein
LCRCSQRLFRCVILSLVLNVDSVTALATIGDNGMVVFPRAGVVPNSAEGGFAYLLGQKHYKRIDMQRHYFGPIESLKLLLCSYRVTFHIVSKLPLRAVSLCAKNNSDNAFTFQKT